MSQGPRAAVRPERILIASSEVHPYSKTGGLADMVAALAKTMARRGHEVGVVTPLYLGLFEKFPGLVRLDYQLRLPMGEDYVQAEVFTLSPQPGLTLYFVHQPEYYLRSGLYSEAGQDYPDNAPRFLFFAKAVAHLARYLPLRPQVVHLHDWQTGMVPLFLHHQKHHEGWADAPPTILTIHNLAYQGVFAREAFAYTNLPRDYFRPWAAEFHGFLNCLKAGIISADQLTTVSPRYAREITTPEFGCGLDPILRHRQAVLRGILNGVDYEEWRTERNPFLPTSYSARNLAGKRLCKAILQQQMGLPGNPDVPLFGSVTRLADQKGVDIQLGALEEMLAANLQFVLLGSGSQDLERAYVRLARRHPDRVAVRIGYDHALSHRIEAGSDFFLMPSRFEPCGLNQMYSLRYATIPIVRVTGGLDDSVVDIAENRTAANGIKFQEYSPRALAKAIRKALALYGTPKLLEQYRRRAIKADFSWDRTASDYEHLYHTSPR
jgi:starch synthase